MKGLQNITEYKKGGQVRGVGERLIHFSCRHLRKRRCSYLNRNLSSPNKVLTTYKLIETRSVYLDLQSLFTR